MALLPLGSTGLAGLHASLHESPAHPSAYGTLGTSDDSAVINAAIAAVAASTPGGGTVIIDQLHTVLSPIQLQDHVTLQGLNTASGFSAGVGFSGSYLVDSNSNAGVQNSYLFNLQLKGNSRVATVLNLAAPSGLPGHNTYAFCTLTGATSQLVLLGGDGFECHAFRNEHSSAGAGIVAIGSDCMILYNNFGSVTTYGIDLGAGGCQVLGNHIVTAGASAYCLRMTDGFVTQIKHNYFDTSTNTHNNGMLILQTGGVGDGIQDLQLHDNQFYDQKLGTDGTYPAITIDQATNGGTIDNVSVVNNTGRALSAAHSWSAIVTTSGTVTNSRFEGNDFIYCDTYGWQPSWLGRNQIYDGTTYFVGRMRQSRTTLTYSASMTPDASKGDVLVITVTNGTAWTMNAPTNPVDGMRLTMEFRNNAGGAMGAQTWNAIYIFPAGVAPTMPADTKRRFIDFIYDNTASKWYMTNQSTGDL